MEQPILELVEGKGDDVGEKEITRSALDARHPLIVILEKGFPSIYKSPDEFLMHVLMVFSLDISPLTLSHHMGKRLFTHQQCLELNQIASEMSSEPWTAEQEQMVANLHFNS